MISQGLYHSLSEQNYNDLPLSCDFFEWRRMHTYVVDCALKCTSQDCFAFGHNESGCAVCHLDSPALNGLEWGSFSHMFKKGK